MRVHPSPTPVPGSASGPPDSTPLPPIGEGRQSGVAPSPRIRAWLWDDLFYGGTFLALTCLTVRPLWLVTYLPLGDLPEHAAQIRSILGFNFYRHDYAVHWFTPYLMAYALTMAFATVTSVTTAIKVVLSIALAGIPLASAALLRTIGGNRYWVWLSFPIAYSFAFYWGFFSYVVATPIAIAFSAFAVWYAKRPLRTGRYALAGAFSLLLFFSHALAWLFGVTTAFVIALMEERADQALKKASAYLSILPLVAYWAALSGAPSNPDADFDRLAHMAGRVGDVLFFVLDDVVDRVERGLHWDRLEELASLAIGGPATWDWTALALLCLAVPLWLGARPARDWKRYAPLATTVAAFLLVPYWLFDTAYVYERFAVFLIPSSFFVFEARAEETMTFPQAKGEATGVTWSRRLRRPAALAASFALVFGLLLRTNRNFGSFRQDDADFGAVLARMKPGKRVLSLVFDQASPFHYSPPYMHFASWYQAEKLGIVIPSFSQATDAQNVPFRYLGRPWRAPSSWAPQTFDWIGDRGFDYDYFVVRSDAPRESLFATAGGAVRLLLRRGSWQLYGRTDEN
ncbi:MAG: hypothetical protein JOZ69_21290 [Myxococcales bacterium]|nr:hypothetical protein [Myxococcales bacterium]